jgi:hypothetical protein
MKAQSKGGQEASCLEMTSNEYAKSRAASFAIVMPTTRLEDRMRLSQSAPPSSLHGASMSGLYVWRDSRYVEAKEELRAKVESLALTAGIEKKVKNQLVNEVIGKLKRKTYFELPDEPLMIAFQNCAFAWSRS